VIRREFDFGEGDPYNKTLIDRAERRLKNLNYFKTVKIASRPGSSPDRVVLDVETVDQPTGDINFAGGYGTTDGWLGEVKLSERNFYGTGYDLRSTATFGQYSRGINLSASAPYFLGTRIAAGVELFGRQSEASYYQSYGTETYGASLLFGTPLTEQLGVQWRYSLYNQNVTLATSSLSSAPSLPIRQAALAGPQWVSSVGSTATYNTLDNTKSLTSGIRSQLSFGLATAIPPHHERYALLPDQQRGRHGADRRLHHRLGRTAGAADEHVLRRPDHGARLCALYFGPRRRRQAPRGQRWRQHVLCDDRQAERKQSVPDERVGLAFVMPAACRTVRPRLVRAKRCSGNKHIVRPSEVSVDPGLPFGALMVDAVPRRPAMTWCSRCGAGGFDGMGPAPQSRRTAQVGQTFLKRRVFQRRVVKPRRSPTCCMVMPSTSTS
jgi:hypothetical protein